MTAHDHDAEEKGLALRVKALEELLVEQGLVEPAALDRIVEAYETRIGPRNGALVVAKAWTDPAFRKRLSDLRTLRTISDEHQPLTRNLVKGSAGDPTWQA